MTPKIKILFVEDLPTDVELAKRTLTKGAIEFQSRVVENETDFIRELEDFVPDIIISDYKMPQFNGMRALKILLEKIPSTPFVLLTGSMNEELAVECIKAGASDYIIKEHITRLPFAVKDVLDKKKIQIEKAKAEFELKESEERFRSLYENSTIGLYRTTPDGKIIMANPSLIKMLGYSSLKEFAMRNLEQDGFEPNYDRKYFIEKIEKTGEVKGLESKWTRKDGTVVYISESAKAFRDSNNKTLYYDGTVEDITERKLAGEALRESEEKFRRSFDSAAVGNCIIGLDKKFLHVNNTFKEIIGYEDDELKNFTFSDITHPDDLSIGLNYFQKLLDGESDRASFEKRYIRKDGKIIWAYISVSLVLNIRNEPQFFINQIVDITERKLMEDDLLKLSRAVEQSPVSIVITDAKGDIEYVNPKLTDITGYQIEDLIGKNPRIFSSGEKLKIEYKILWDTITSGNEWQGELHNKKKNGDLYWESASISPIKNEKGNITHFIAIKEDITERKRILEELVQTKDKAEEMNKLKSNFLVNMSHELRTPLIGINGFAEFLIGSLKDPELKEMAENILTSGNRLSETLNLILDITKIESDKMDFKSERVDLISEIETIINSFMVYAHRKGLYIRSSFTNPIIYLHTDKRAIRSILNNLINNAVKYTADGGVTVSVSLYDKYIEIKIIDTGMGIQKKDQKIIFDEFRQVSEGFSRNYEGAGLGLSITKKLVEKFGGKITVESEFGKGSSFIVILPVNEAKAKKEIPLKETRKPVITPNLNKVKPIALLVDDDPFVFNVLKRYLSEVVELESISEAKSAINMVKKKKFDMIFMDINLRRGLDGKQATQEIRKINGYETIPIIATTAYAMPADKEEFLAAGCSHYLSKPFMKQSVLNLVEDILSISQKTT